MTRILKSLGDIANEDIVITVVKSMKMDYRYGSFNDYTAAGRKTNLLFYLINGKFTYSIGGSFICDYTERSVIFMPITYKYRSEVTGYGPKSGCSTGIFIDFLMTDGNGDDIYVNEPLKIIPDTADRYFLNMFTKVSEAGMNSVSGKLACKAHLYLLLDALAAHLFGERMKSGSFSAIRPAIEHIETHPELNTPSAELAAMCYVSESYMRRKFKDYTGGYAPAEYRNYLRIKKAKELLGHENTTVEGLADSLGFYDAPHFYKVYKKFAGESPAKK